MLNSEKQKAYDRARNHKRRSNRVGSTAALDSAAASLDRERFLNKEKAPYDVWSQGAGYVEPDYDV